jgi:divalent metal cation (Fe/Co/Zn/Cd) transporter
VRSRGRRDAVYVDLTVHLDGGMSLHQAHDVADRIEVELEKVHPEIVDVVVHLEPEGHEDPPGA